MYLNKTIYAILKKYNLIANNEYDINIEYDKTNKNNVLLISDDMNDKARFIKCADELNKQIKNEIYFYYLCDNFIYVANKNAIDENM